MNDNDSLSVMRHLELIEKQLDNISKSNIVISETLIEILKRMKK